MTRYLTCWDYHHGQSTRILVAGFGTVPGQSMGEKQAHFQREMDDLRTAVLQEPRGHRNMLGAVITPPVSEGSLVGVLFTHPSGYFDMCGDSAFSVACYLADSGIVANVSRESSIQFDTVAGPVRALLTFGDGRLEGVSIVNVASHLVGTRELHMMGDAVESVLAYGGLSYAFISAEAVGIDSLKFATLSQNDRSRVVATGSIALEAARAATGSGTPFPRVDLVTLYERLPEVHGQGARVANFYNVQTMGRTPSGTGLSARLAWEFASGRIGVGDEFIHESVLGLRFVGSVEQELQVGASDGADCAAIIPRITARSFLMGIQTVVLEDADPFRSGFTL